MPVRREQVAAALKYLGDKADVKRRYERMVSLDQPTDSDAVDMALEMGGSVIPGVGQALAARDFERARRADDPAGMAMAGASALPLGRLAGALKQYDPVMRELDVYHGTPHRFPSTETNPLGEFDASKINTGEGAQAYGHGIYLAESPKVAEGYKKRLAGASYVKDSQSVAYGKIWQQAADAAQETGKVHPDYARAVSSQIMDWVDGGRKPETFLRYKRVPENARPAYEAAIKQYAGLEKTKGNLYKADLPDEMVDRMLDYDKLLSEQQGLLKIAKKINDKYVRWGEPVETGTGKELYESLEAQVGTIKATEIMRKAGIPGIKYADAGSRGQGGTGTRNFVVFPGEEKKVKILKRE